MSIPKGLAQAGHRLVLRLRRMTNPVTARDGGEAFQHCLDLTQSGKFHAALSYARGAQRKWPKDRRLIRSEVRALLNLGRAEEAQTVLRRLEDSMPDPGKIDSLRRAVARAIVKQSSPAEGLILAQDALKTWPDDEGLQRLAMRLHKQVERDSTAGQKRRNSRSGGQGLPLRITAGLQQLRERMFPPTHITTFGTCRVYKPVNYLVQQRSVILNNGQFTNYTQSMPEILQQMRVMKRDLTLPVHLEPFFFDRTLPPEEKRRFPDLTRTDMVICEISTTRHFSYDGTYFQVNYLMRNLIKPHGGLLRPWFAAANALDEARREEALRDVLSTDHGLSDLEIDMLENIHVAHQTPAELHRDILLFRDTLDVPLLLVTHCDVIGNKGERIPTRVALIEDIVRIAHAENIAVYQPSVLIEKHGQAVAMDHEGTDSNHYHPEFYPVVGKHLMANWIS